MSSSTARDQRKGQKEKVYSQVDGILRNRICRVVARNPLVDEAKITVEVFYGIAYIGGCVTTVTEKHLVEDEARVIPGIREIVSTIEIIPSMPGNNIRIVGEILQSLSHCLNLDLSQVSVVLQSGVVYLRGIVPSHHQKTAAADLARATPQVKDVVNELAVLS